MVREAEKRCLRSSTGRSIKQIILTQRNVQKQVHVARTTSIFVRTAWWEIWCKITLKEGRIYCKTQEKMNFQSLTLEDARSVFGEPWVLILCRHAYILFIYTWLSPGIFNTSAGKLLFSQAPRTQHVMMMRMRFQYHLVKPAWRIGSHYVLKYKSIEAYSSGPWSVVPYRTDFSFVGVERERVAARPRGKTFLLVV